MEPSPTETTIARTRTDSLDSTYRLAARIQPILRAGDLIVLSGDLGGGKTAFTQGLARAMGIADAVTSPTFTLVQSYEGTLKLHHVDFYRLRRQEEVADLGLAELLADRAVTVIEWGERFLTQLPRDYLLVRLIPGDATQPTSVRFVEFEVEGTWQTRADAITRAVHEFDEFAASASQS